MSDLKAIRKLRDGVKGALTPRTGEAVPTPEEAAEQVRAQAELQERIKEVVSAEE